MDTILVNEIGNKVAGKISIEDKKNIFILTHIPRDTQGVSKKLKRLSVETCSVCSRLKDSLLECLRAKITSRFER